MSSPIVIVTYFILIFIMLFLVTPVVIYWGHQIWKLRNEPFFNKRHPKLTIISLIWWSLWPSIANPIDQLQYIFPNVPYPFSSPNFFMPFGAAIFAINFVRLWFYYYDYNRALQLVSKEWKSKLISSSSQMNNNNQDLSYWALDNEWMAVNLILYTIY